MKLLNLKLILLVLLICLAFASAAYALKPLIFRVEKQVEIEQAIEAFEEAREKTQPAPTEAETPTVGEPVKLPYAELLRDMSYYNARIYVNRQEGLNSRSAYAVSHFDLGSYGLSSEVFGVIRIPAMDLEMPLYLGASDANMANGAAVLAQTSIPIGGESTHAVIAGHTGLPTAELFTHLTDLKEGDIFLIRVLGETHRYEIDSIRVVWPEEESAYLGVENGQDLVTLYTCTPYGINDRRLLVRGRRIYPDLENGSAGGQELRFTENNYLLVVKAILLASLAPLIFMTGVIRLVKGQKKKGKKKWRDAGNGADAYEETEYFRDDRFEFGYRGTGGEVYENEPAARHPACRSESYGGSVTPGESAFAGRFETYGSFYGDADHVYRGTM